MFSYHLIHPPLTFILATTTLEDIFRSVDEAVEISQHGVINIAFVTDPEIQRLNKTYRNIDAVTDVLSFHYFDDFSLIDRDEVAGEIVLSESRIASQSREHDHSESQEASILIIHGLLHILGYDHEEDWDFEEMFAVEKILRMNMWLNIER
jgi:probable rRNA maturation factor